MSFKGKNIVVSGGTTGIGRSLVDKFINEGANIGTFARNETHVLDLKENYPSIFAKAVDVSDLKALKLYFSEL